MRKHFLILMLLTLLPYVAWAGTPLAQNTPAVKANQEWTNQPLGLVATAVELPGDYDTSVGHVYYIALKSSQTAPIKSNSGWSTELPTKTDIGGYTVYYYITNDGTTKYDTDGDVTPIGTTQITKATIKAANITSPVVAVADANRKYDGGAEVNLVTAPEFTGIINDEIITEYSTDGVAWSETIPTATVCGVNYTIQWRTKETTHYESYAGANVTTSLNKADLTTGDFTLPTVISPLKYTGVGQQIFSVNSTTNRGTVYFNVADQGFTYEVDNAKAIANLTPGTTHQIPYYVKSNDPNYNDLGSAWTPYANIPVTIENGQATAVAPTLVSGWTYDGSEHSLLDNAGSATHGTLVYYLGESETPLTQADVKALNAGTYTVSYSVTGDPYFDGVAKTTLPTTLTIAQKSLTVSASTPVGDFTYGTPIDAYSLIKTSGWVSADNNDGTKKNVLFGLNDTNRLLNVTMDGEAFNAETVYSAGTHQFAVEVADPNKSNYTPDFMNQVITLTIKAKEATVTAPTAASVVAFNNDFQTLIAAGTTTGGTLKYAITSVDGVAVAGPAWSTDLPTAKDAGSYVVSYKLDGGGDYEDQAAVALDAIVIPTAAGGAAPTDQTAEALVYSGDEISLIQAGANTNGKWMYQLDGGEWTETVPVATDVKANNAAYLVNYKFVADKNYTNVDALADPKEVKITQATNAITSLTIEGWTFSDAANDPAATAKFGTPVFTYLAAGSSVYSETVPTAAGIHTVKASVAATDNYAAAESTTTFEIAQAGNKFNTLTIEGWTYGATANAPVATADYGIGTVVYTYSIKGADVFSAEVPENAGEYTVKATIAETSDYAAAVMTADFTIAKATATVTAPTANNLTFNGEDQDLVAAGSTSGGTLKYSLNNVDYAEAIPTGMDAGGYTVYYKVEGGTNYNDVAAQQIAVTIAQKPVTPVVPTAIALSYNGLEQALVNAGSAEGATIQYALGEGEFGDAIPTAKDAGTYSVNYKFTVNPNYSVATESGVVNVKINKAHLEYSLGNQEATWTGKTFEPVEGEAFVLTNGDLMVGDEFTYSFPETVGSNAGSYNFSKVVVNGASKDNYTIQFHNNGTLTINKANIVAADFEAPKAIEAPVNFDGSEKDLFEAASWKDDKNYGTFEYSADGEDWGNALTTGVNEGEYNLYYKIVGDVNHNDYVSDVVLSKTILQRAWEVAASAWMDDTEDGIVVTYDKKQNFKPAAEALDLFDKINGSSKKLTNGTDYKLVITKGEEDVTEATVLKDAATYTFTYTGLGNYAAEGNTYVKTLTINKAELADGFALTSETEVYNTANQLPTLKAATGLEQDVDFTVDAPKEAINVGEYTFTITPSDNYYLTDNVESYTKTFTITPVILPETAFSLSATEAVYSSENQLPELTAEGLTEGTEYNVVKSATEAVNAGEYTFTITPAANYALENDAESYVKTFTITPATLLVSSANYAKVYDGTDVITDDNLVGDTKFVFGGLKKNDDASVVTISEGAVTAPAAVNVGTYDLTVDATKFKADNYDIKANDVKGQLTISAAPLAVNFAEGKEFSKAYGAAEPVYAAADYIALEGAVNTADKAAILAAITIERTNADVNEVGTYEKVIKINVDTDADVFANYETPVVAENADFEITPAALIIALKNSIERAYNGEDAVVEVTPNDLAVSGMDAGDAIADIFDTLPSATVVENVEGEGTKNVGTYIIKLSGAVAPNYTITDASYVDGQYIITPAKLTATVQDQALAMGETTLLDPDAFEIQGAVEGDKLNAALSINADINTPGVYNEGIVLSFDNDNYVWAEGAKYTAKLTVVNTAETITLARSNDVQGVIEVLDGKTVNVTFSSRNLQPKKWNSFIFPFAISASKLSKVFDYAIINTLNTETSKGDQVHFQLEMGMIPANTPILMKVNKMNDAETESVNVNMSTVVINNVTIEKPESWTVTAGSESDPHFVGVYERTHIDNALWSFPNNEGDSDPWVGGNPEGSIYLNPLAAYLVKTSVNARIFVEDLDANGATAIKQIAADGTEIAAEGWYTVNGMKLDKAPVEKGVYVKDGKKVVIK